MTAEWSEHGFAEPKKSSEESQCRGNFSVSIFFETEKKSVLFEAETYGQSKVVFSRKKKVGFVFQKTRFRSRKLWFREAVVDFFFTVFCGLDGFAKPQGPTLRFRETTMVSHFFQATRRLDGDSPPALVASPHT